MAIDNSTTTGYPDNTGGTMRLANDGDSADGVFIIADGDGVLWERVVDGPFRAAWAKVLGGGSDMASRLQTVIDHPDVSEIVFDIANTDITIDSAVTATGKNFIFKNGCRLIGSGTITGGYIIADETADVIGEDLDWTMENQVVYGCWFGAKGDYNITTGAGTMCHAALQKAVDLFNASKNDPNKELVIPAGIVALDDELVTPNSASNFIIRGYGIRNTMIYWRGTGSSKDMIRIVNGQQGYVGDFGITGAGNITHGASTPDRVINVYSTQPINGNQGMIGDMVFQNIRAYGNLGVFRDGLAYTCNGANDSAADANNEQGNIINCYFERATRYGLSFEHFNSTWHRIIGGRFSGLIAGVNSFRDDDTAGGSFMMYRSCVMGINATGYQFKLCGGRGQYVMDGCTSEGGRFILYARESLDSPSPSTPNIIMRCCEFVIDGGAGYHIDVDGTLSNLEIINCKLDSLVKIIMRSSDSYLHINGGNGNYFSIDYDGVVAVENCSAVGPSTALNNLGNGRIYFSKSSGLHASFTEITGGATPNFEAYETAEMTYSTPTTITDFLGGYPGKIIMITSTNNNLTLYNPARIVIPTNRPFIIRPSRPVRFMKTASNDWQILDFPWQNSLPGMNNLNADTSFVTDYAVTLNFVVVATAADCPTFSIGTSAGGSEILSPTYLVAGEVYTFNLGFYASFQSIYLDGLTGPAAGVYVYVTQTHLGA